MQEVTAKLAKIAKMSSNRKGSYNQNRSERYLSENLGITYTAPKPSHRAATVDIFSCFDHIGIISKTEDVKMMSYVDKNGEPTEPAHILIPGTFFLVQTKSNKGYYGSRAKIQEFGKIYAPRGAHILQIAWIDYELNPYIERLVETRNFETNEYTYEFKPITIIGAKQQW